MDLSKLKNLLKQNKTDGSGYKLIENVVLAVKSKWDIKENTRLRFVDVDFNSPILGTFWTKPVFKECIFKDCNLDGINAENTIFSGCTFDKCKFGQKYFNSFLKCKFQECIFNDCDLTNVEFNKTQFEIIEFKNGKLQKANFRECVLKGFIFFGEIKTVNFINCTAAKVDLKNAIIYDSSLIDNPNQQITLPDRVDNFVAFPGAFEIIKDQLKQLLSKKGYEEYCDVADFVSSSKYGEIIDIDLFEEINMPERKIIMDLLYEKRHTR